MINLSTGAFYERSTQQISTLRGRAESLQQQIGTGERLERSSDDPVAAARLRMLDRKEHITQIDTRNSDQAESDLQLADQALSSIANIVIRARELAVQTSNSTLSNSQLASIAIEIDGLRGSLLTISNARNSSGHALFGGQATGNAYEEVAGTVNYIGTATLDELEIGEGQTIAPGAVGPEVFNFDAGAGATDLFAELSAFAAALRTGGQTAVDASKSALGILDAGLDKVTTSQTVIGSRLNWLDLMAERRENNIQQITDERSEIGGADIAVTLSRLQELTTALEASQASFVRLANLSLFSMLR